MKRIHAGFNRCGALAACLLVVLSAFWFQIESVAAQSGAVINEVRVQGIERIGLETVRNYITLRAGQNFDPGQVDKSLKALFATGLFSDVSIRREGGLVIIKVAENPIINRVAFEGNDVMEKAVLLTEIKLRSRVVYTRTRVQNDVKRIQDLYRSQGRFAVQVNPKVILKSQNRVDLVFEIIEGESTNIRKITFIGNRLYSNSRLRSVISSAETRWYTFLTADDVFDADRMAFDRELLRRYYIKNGYPEFAVLSSTAELSTDSKSFFLTFTVDEGPRYKFGEVKISSKLKSLDVDTLYKMISFQKSKIYNADLVEKTVNVLADAVGTLGFAFVEVNPVPKRNRDKLTVDLEFVVSEGPRTFVERIDITNNLRTEDSVIRREFRLIEGDAFNSEKYRLSQRRIRNLGFFKSSKFTEKPGSAPDKTMLNLRVEEQSTGSLSLGGGFSSTKGLTTEVGLNERNLLGKGQKIGFKALLGTKSQNFDISFTEPYFLERNMSAGIDLFNSRSSSADTIRFRRNRIGFGLRTGFRYNESLRQQIGYVLESKKIDDVDEDASLYVQRQEGTTLTSVFSQSLTYDMRDSRLNPTEGFVVRLSNDLAGLGGDNKYFRSTLIASKYYSAPFNWITRFSSAFGYVVGLGEDIRIDDRYFVGGDALRGFAPGGIGPRDTATKDALGGIRYFTALAESSIPISPTNSFKPRGFIFSDVGTLTDSGESGTGILDDDLIRISLGVGLGFTTPFGEIRMNFSQAFRKASFDDVEVFSFRVGTIF